MVVAVFSCTGKHCMQLEDKRSNSIYGRNLDTARTKKEPFVQ